MVVEDFPGLADMSRRLVIHDKERLGGWLFELSRWEEAIDLLKPLIDQLSFQLDQGEIEVALSNNLEKQMHQSIYRLRGAYIAVNDQAALEALNELSGPPDWIPLGDPRRDGPPRPGPRPPRRRPLDRIYAIDAALSYDENRDNKLTRNELPVRMGQEWFDRADRNSNSEIDERELERMF